MGIGNMEAYRIFFRRRKISRKSILVMMLSRGGMKWAKKFETVIMWKKVYLILKITTMRQEVYCEQGEDIIIWNSHLRWMSKRSE